MSTTDPTTDPTSVLSDADLTEVLKTCTRAGSWNAAIGDRLLMVRLDDFVAIVENHCYGVFGSEDNVIRKVAGGAFVAVRLESSDYDEVQYDVVVALHPDDIPHVPVSVRGYTCTWITDHDWTDGHHTLCGEPALYRVAEVVATDDANPERTPEGTHLCGIHHQTLMQPLWREPEKDSFAWTIPPIGPGSWHRVKNQAGLTGPEHFTLCGLPGGGNGTWKYGEERPKGYACDECEKVFTELTKESSP